VEGGAPESLSYRAEIVRKAIHLSSAALAILYFFTPRSITLGILGVLTAAVVSIDVARYYHRPLEDLFNATFGSLLRRHESDTRAKRLSGASYVLISATLCALIFPKLIAITGFLVLIIADATSALIGRRFGRHRFMGKSFEGSLAFFLSALVVVLLTPKIEYAGGEYLLGAVAAAAGALVEALPWPVDDNLTIPLSVGAVLWAGYSLFFPALNLNKF
jgi:dolichol kinase